MIEANANLEGALTLLDSRLESIERSIQRSAWREEVTTRVLRLPIGLMASQTYAVVGGPQQGRMWQIRRITIGSVSTLPVTAYSDESLSPSSTLWIFDTEPAQRSWSHLHMVLLHPDKLVLTAGAVSATMAGQCQIVDTPIFGTTRDEET